METTSKNYITPEIEIILLDNEISLQLESNPPLGPNETNNQYLPEVFQTNPYRDNLG